MLHWILFLKNNSVDIHTLLKQMGNSAEMIDLHGSKLISKLTAERLAK